METKASDLIDQIEKDTLEGWKEVKSEKGVKVWVKESDLNIKMVKAQGIIETDIDTCIGLLYDREKRKEISKETTEFRLMETVSNDPAIHIVYCYLKSPTALMSDRDCYLLRTSKREGDIFTYAESSTVDGLEEKTKDDIPANRSKNCIQYDVFIQGAVIKYNSDSNECLVTIIMQMDPKGWIPKWVTNGGGPEGSIKTFDMLRTKSLK